MDSSGSMQSSSGGDEEYESRADSITAAFISHHGGSLAGNFHHPPQSSAMFDPLSNLFDPRPSIANPNPNPLLNLDMAWSRAVRSNQIPPDLGAPAPNSSTVNHNLPSLSTFSAPQNFSHPPEGTNSLRGLGLGSEQPERDNVGGGGGGGANVVRSSKKRPRASRRAPTTVLTTDTTNFRAMVQEFTGIPAPPFTSSSSPFPRNTRFDLFGTTSAAAAAQPYLLRPFAQKPAFLSPSPPPSNFLAGNLQTSVFDGHFHNMFQSNPKLISKASSSTLEILQNNDQNLKMGIFEEFGLSTQGLPPAGEALPSTATDDNNNNNRNPPPARWVAGDGGESDQQALNLRSGNGNSNGKLIRYAGGTGNSSEFLGDNAPENVSTTARSEGTVEPWICSSD